MLPSTTTRGSDGRFGTVSPPLKLRVQAGAGPGRWEGGEEADRRRLSDGDVEHHRGVSAGGHPASADDLALQIRLARCFATLDELPIPARNGHNLAKWPMPLAAAPELTPIASSRVIAAPRSLATTRPRNRGTTAGHYHRTLVARLRTGGQEVVELNPAAVKEARAQQLLRRLKSDARDLGAMAELMVRRAGRRPAARTDALATQAAWVAHRRRKVAARVALANQVIGHLDLVFPGLNGCFPDLLSARAGRVIVTDICDPDRVRRQGVQGLRRFVARRGVALSGPKAAEVVEAARVALRLPGAERVAQGKVLAADLALLTNLEAGIIAAEAALAEVLADTPSAILASLPGVAVVRASNHGAGIGEPARLRNAAAAYRAAGLVPALYESAGRSRSGQHISREGSVELVQAIIEIGRGLAQHEADFRDYRRRLLNSGKPALVAAVAVGHRASGPPSCLRHAARPAALRPGPVGRVGGGGHDRHGEGPTGPAERRDVPAAAHQRARRG